MSDHPRPTVLVCQPLLAQNPGPYLGILESGGFEVRFPERKGRALTEDELAGELGGVSATIASTEPYTAQILADAKSLRVISRTGVGYDSINVPAATQNAVAIGCTPGTNHEAVAEHVFALLLGLTKQVVANHVEVSRAGFKKQPSKALRGKTIGIVGLGRIGRAVAFRATAFGMHVLAHDPLLDASHQEIGGPQLVSLDDLLAHSDILSLHAASTDATRHMLRRETLERTKIGVIVINTARGTLIDERALADALTSGRVAAAGLDVFDREPPVDSPLLTAPNVLLSPHIAGVDEQSFEDMANMAARTIVDLYTGSWPAERLVNADQLAPSWSWLKADSDTSSRDHICSRDHT